jgi:hypothetical protein
MLTTRLALVLCCCIAIGATALAQSAFTPAAGTPERKAIMDALRVRAEKDLEQKVIFNVDTLKVAGDWAYARVTPTKPNGDDIDFSETRYSEQVELGAFDPQGEALLRRSGDSWKVIEWAFGGTDVASAEWPDKYRLPKSLLD